MDMNLDAETPGDVDALMERLRRQQEEIERIQRSVEASEVTGGSRGDEVRVTVRGNGRVMNVTIDPDAVRRYDAHELGEMVTEAVNDGLRRAAEATSAKFQPIIEAASRVEAF
jgi:nucleoid-associated protein EbfC